MGIDQKFDELFGFGGELDKAKAHVVAAFGRAPNAVEMALGETGISVITAFVEAAVNELPEVQEIVVAAILGAAVIAAGESGADIPHLVAEVLAANGYGRGADNTKGK